MPKAQVGARGRVVRGEPGTSGSSVVRSAHAEQVDDEDQRLAAEPVTAGRAVRQLRRDGQLAPTADLHSRNAVLPALDQAAERELDRLAAIPRRVELGAGL